MAISLRDQTSQVLLFIIVLSLGGGLVYTFLLKPMQDEIDTANQQSREMQAQIQQMQAVERKLPQYKREIEDQKKHLEELKAALPDAKETAAVIRQVQEYAVASSIRIRSFRPQETIAREFYTEWPIQMEFDGSYHHLGSFFEKISRHSRVINVTNLSIKRVPDSLDPGRTINSSCTATTFVYKEGK